MHIQSFNSLVDEVCAYFERNLPRDTTVHEWYKRLDRIPDEAVPWIARSLTERNRECPRNFPNAVLSLWQEWVQDHPKRVDHSFSTCPDCDQGLIHVRRDTEGGLSAGYVFRCKRCGRSDLSAYIPLAFRSEILENGYQEDTT